MFRKITPSQTNAEPNGSPFPITGISAPELSKHLKLINRVLDKSLSKLMAHIATEHTRNKIEQ